MGVIQNEVSNNVDGPNVEHTDGTIDVPNDGVIERVFDRPSGASSPTSKYDTDKSTDTNVNGEHDETVGDVNADDNDVVNHTGIVSAEEWKEREFFTPSASEIMMLLEKVELLLDKMKDYDKSLERIYELRDRLIESTNDLVERMEELEGSDMSLRPYYRSAIRFNSYLTTAYIHPCSQIANIVFSASRAVIVLCQRAVKTIDPVVNHSTA